MASSLAPFMLKVSQIWMKLVMCACGPSRGLLPNWFCYTSPTIANLILKLFDCTSGLIMLDPQPSVVGMT